jgi:3-oxoacyl-[acyl-carrier protein] reductase
MTDTIYALITGASSGIGAAAAVRLARDGYGIVAHYNSDEAGAAATVARCAEVSAIQHHLVQADLSSAAGVVGFAEAVAAKAGDVGVLVNNAGSLIGRSPFEELTDDHVQRVVDLNFTTAILVSRDFLPALKRRRGAVVNVSSIAAYSGGGGGSAIYAAAKGAIVSLTRALAKEVAPAGVRVNAIAPGVIATPFHDRFTKPEMMKVMLGTIPMGRFGTSEEFADLVSFLVGPQSAYITGQTIHINGGQFLG